MFKRLKRLERAEKFNRDRIRDLEREADEFRNRIETLEELVKALYTKPNQPETAAWETTHPQY